MMELGSSSSRRGSSRTQRPTAQQRPPVQYAWFPSPVGYRNDTPLIVKILLWVLFIAVIAGAAFAFTVAMITFIPSYLTNTQVHKRGHELLVNFGSGFKRLIWGSETWFDEVVHMVGVTATRPSFVDTQMLAIKLWTQNMTDGVPGTLFYSVNAVMDTLTRDVLAALQVVDPAELQAFLDSLFRKREVLYTSEFVNYLALVESEIVGLQNTTRTILAGNYCHGKPLDAASVALTGDQVLAPNSNTTLPWGAVTQQPTGLNPAYFVSNGTNLLTQFNGVFGVSFAANMLVAPNSYANTVFTLYVNGAAWTQLRCRQDQIDTIAQTFIQCQTAGVLRLSSGSALRIDVGTSDAVTLFGWNTRWLLTRVC